MKNSREKRKR